MAAIKFVTLEVAEPAAARDLYTTALGLDTLVQLRALAPTTGFRGFTLSPIVSQPATFDNLIDTAKDAGATVL